MDVPGKIYWPRLRRCRICGARGVQISLRGRCSKCSMQKNKKVNAQMIEKKGYYWNRRKAGLRRYLKNLE